MFNPNYEYGFHCAVEFVYSANGSYDIIMRSKVVQSIEKPHTTILGIIYLLFVIYNLIIALLSIRTQWVKINVRRLEEEYLRDERLFELNQI